MAIFKSLQFKDDRTKILGRYAMPIGFEDWGGINIPQLMNPETTIRTLQKVYPKHNFKDVKLVILKVEELKK